MNNLLSSLPDTLDKEAFESVLAADGVRIERILSKGHASPEEGWYDQGENEWVLVLEGAGTLLFEDGRKVLLNKGDHCHIPAHTRHRVIWTDPEQVTIWLAVFY
ncbi:MAG: cupin domain-containing protein [Halomonadaceae bacterium]|nr:MAG: cupin domain-containing protein [Halomonadaceae bacterium]